MTGQLDIILQGVVGSTAYGLNHAESDLDYLGVYIASSRELFGLGASKVLDSSIVTKDPDSTLHELHKFCRNAIKCNPTMLELLFLPNHTISTRIGSELVNLRSYFLSEGRVRNAYAGYVQSQAGRLLKRSESGMKGFDPDLAKRTHKHARHCYRLLLQGSMLLSTGEMEVDVSDYRDQIWQIADLAEQDPELFYERITVEVANLEDMDSCLPEEPDYVAVNNFLYEARRQYVKMETL